VLSTYGSYLTSEAKKLTEFQVNAPPGDLGLVLGTSEEGIAIVEEITRFSPLIGQVRVGDRLVALDGRDNTMMIATTTS
jgi:C-terminal processing protease CtpA/Prc